MDDIYYKLAEIVNLSYKDSSDYLIGKMMLLKLEEIPSYTIDVMAKVCFTSTASITRFCQKLGYESFKEFKKNISLDMQLFKNTAIHGNRKLEINKALLLTKNRFDYLANHASAVILKSQIENLAQEIIRKEHIVIVCATKELTAMSTFQAALRLFNKKVDIVVCNSDPSKMDYVEEDNSLFLFVTYGGRWINRSRNLVRKVQQSKGDSIVLCLDDRDIKKIQVYKVFCF